jgi:hypothetical protein
MTAPDAGSEARRPSLEDQLKAMEHRRLAALVAKDGPVARSLHADDYELITPGGARLSGAQYLDGVLSGPLDYEVFEPEGDIRVRVHATVAILRYAARIRMRMPDGVDEGRFWHTDVYELRDGEWRAVWSHATRTSST